MYCDKCGRLAHGERPCGTITTMNVEHGTYHSPLAPIVTPHTTGPTMVVIAPPNRRLESGGWFARSFMTTAGIVAALLALPAAGCVLLLIALITVNVVDSDDGLTKDAKRLAIETMARHGVARLSSDSVASRRGADVILTGNAKMTGGKVRPYAIRFRVARFDREERWDVVSLSIDGKEHYSQP